MNGRFIDNLPKVYGLYTGGFLVFIGLMAVLEQMGTFQPTRWASCLLPSPSPFTPTIGWLSRTMETRRLLCRRTRSATALYNGMATAADWMSGASFVAMAGGVYFGGYGYLAFIVGWTGGYVLVNSLLRPLFAQIRLLHRARFHRHALWRQYGPPVWPSMVLVVASFTYVTAQINATGTIAARALANSV